MLCHVKTFYNSILFGPSIKLLKSPLMGKYMSCFVERAFLFPLGSLKDVTTAAAARTSKKQYRLNTRQNNNSARAARFFVHFSAVTARLRLERERAKTKVSLSL